MKQDRTNLLWRFYALNLILSAGLFLADTLSETLFLSEFGIAYLPLGLGATALLSVAVAMFNARFLNRLSPKRLLGIMLGVATAVAVFIWLGLIYSIPFTIPIFFLAFRPIRDLLLAQTWNFFAKQYDSQQAKRYFPVLSSAGRVGAIIGYIGILALVSVIGSSATTFAWIVTLVLAGGVLFSLPRRRRPAATTNEKSPEKQEASLTREAVNNYPLIKYIIGYAVLTIGLVLFLTYQIGASLVTAYPNPDNLSLIYASIGIVSNIFGWLFQIFVLPRIIRRFGLPVTNIFYPAVALGASAWLGVDGSVPAAVTGQVTRTTLRQSLQVPVEDLLFNALPQNLKSATRTLLRGAIIPAGAVIASLVLLGLQNLAIGGTIIAIMTMVFGVGNLAMAYLTSRKYREATLALVREQNLIAQRLALSGFDTPSPEVLQILEERIHQSSEEEEAVFLAEILLEVGKLDAEKILVDRILTAEPELKVALLDVMSQREIAGKSLKGAAEQLLSLPEPEVRRATLGALLHARGLMYLSYLPMLEDDDASVRLSAVELLAYGNQPAYRWQLSEALDKLLADEDEEVRAGAVRMVPRLAPDKLIEVAVDEAPRVRLAAVEAAVELPQLASRTVLFGLLQEATQDDTEAIRRAAIQAIAHAGVSAIPVLIETLRDRSPAVRNVAIEALTDIGRPSIGPLQNQLNGTNNPAVREAALTALVHLMPDKRLGELGEFENQTLTDAYNTILIRKALANNSRGAVSELLLDDLDDELQMLVDRLYRLLAVTNGYETAVAIENGLRSPDKDRKAQAWEALEIARSPRRAELMSVLASEGDTQMMIELAQNQLGLSVPEKEQALTIVQNSGSEWRHQLVEASQSEMNTSVTSLFEKESKVLSVIEKAIFLRAVPSFKSMTTEQLRLLAAASEELSYASGEVIFNEGDPGDKLMVIVHGRVGIEGKKGRSVVRIETLNSKDSFGELTVFDAQPQTTKAIAVDDCLILAIRRDVLLDLIRRYPDLSFEIIKFLSHRLRDTTSKVAEKTKARTRQVVDLFDKFSE